MVLFIIGVVKLLPVNIGAPPVADSYHLTVELPDAVAFRVTVPGPQRVAGVLVNKAGLLTGIVLEGCKQTTPAPFLISNLK